MLGYIPPNPYDLHFRLLGTPVRVHPFFWIISFVLGYNASASGLGSDSGLALIWVAAVFVSILWHEFGHVLAARAFHWRADEVVLYQMGGYAALVPPSGKRLVVNDVLISLAGPCAGFLLFGLILLVKQIAPQLLTEFGSSGRMFWGYMLYINLTWGIFNLLPIFPLDGGQAARVFLVSVFRNGSFLAAGLSVLVAAGVGLYMFQQGNAWIAILMVMLLLENLKMLQRF